MKIEKATFAAGCFWGVEEAFRKVEGVINTRVGYTGGDFENPTYEDVCSDETGHAEAVEVEFDQSRVSYKHLLDKFWSIHDPTALNRQGPDKGSQYRSVIFYHDLRQKETAEASKADLESSGAFKDPIVTSIEPARIFFQAEDYHQRYFEKKGGGTCHI